MLDNAEKCLLKLEQGAQLSSVYNDIFRVFHSVKGGAGMFGLTDLQELVHAIETNFQNCKSEPTISADQASYFLKGVDMARGFFEGKKISTMPAFPGKNSSASAPSPTPAPQAKVVSAGTTPKDMPKEQPSNQTGELVYIIDDEAPILDILQDIVTTKGFQVKCFTSSKEALTAMEKDHPLVIITDYKMPDFSGFDVLKRTRAKFPSTQVIFLSGLLEKDILIESIAVGLFAAIEKPFTPTQVLPLLEQAIEKSRLQRMVTDALNFIFYQYSDLKAYLKAKGDDTLSEIMEEQLQNLLMAKKKIGKL